MQNQAAQQVVEALKKANNVMVTVTSSPSVDELTAAVGLTLILNHMNKHATTVFSGQIPSTIEFLQPEMAIETNTDSLRDFIISLDKSKADKLRYKVEDNVVRIFITPYKTSISQHDLEFSQGDYNVDVVIALGVVSREDFDQAVNTHGRILHDATIIGVTNQNVVSQIGAVNWNDPQASSISEMISGITDRLGPNVLDGQIATALMTGIVSETDRFRNSKTTPKVLSLSSKLMTAGANQQLIADKLEEKLDVQAPSSEINNADSSDGMLEIGHEEGEELQDIQIDDHGNINNAPSQSGLNLQTAPSFQNSSNQSQVQPQSQTQVPQPMPISQANEPPVSEVPAHQYISEPATTPAEDVSGDVDIAAAPQNDLPGVKNLEQRPSPTSDYDQLVEHGHKVIEPIKDDTLAPDPLATSILAEQNNTSVKPVTAADDVELPPPPKNVSTSLPPENDSQTLKDLETAVHSNHVNTTSKPADVEDYTGSIRKPANQTEQPLPTPPPAKPDSPVLEPIIVQPNNKLDNSTVGPPPQVTSPSNDPPAVPPPIMPPTTTQPQFYEADGSKGNPLLNPNSNS